MSQFDLLQFRDFLREYNCLTERCFKICVNNLNSRNLADDEVNCVSQCATKYLNINQRVMKAYQELQPEVLLRRNAEAEAQMKLLAEKQNEEAKIDTIVPAVTENPESTVLVNETNNNLNSENS